MKAARKPRLVRFGSATFNASTDTVTCELCGTAWKVVYPTTMKALAEKMQAFAVKHAGCVIPSEATS